MYHNRPNESFVWTNIVLIFLMTSQAAAGLLDLFFFFGWNIESGQIFLGSTLRCFDINLCWQCVKNPPTPPLQQISLVWHEVLILLLMWGHTDKAPPKGTDWQSCITIVSTLSLRLDLQESDLFYLKALNSCVSITLQIVQVRIANWKYRQWKRIYFAKNFSHLHEVIF